MIKLYGRGQSRSFRAVWALTETGIPFDYIEVTDTVGESTDYQNLNYQRKVPTLVDGGTVLTESAAMVNYAGLVSGKLMPSSTEERARFDEISYFVMTDFEQPLWTIGKHRFALPEPQRLEPMIETAIWEYNKSQDALLNHLAGREFAVGNHFTLADVLVAHTLNWAIRFDMPVAQALVDYRNRQYERSACIASLELVTAVG